MISFYYNLSPNPMKVALFLEETGLPYEPNPVDTRKGDQFAPEYLAINPNGKVPAIVDGQTVVFDSNAILLFFELPLIGKARAGSTGCTQLTGSEAQA